MSRLTAEQQEAIDKFAQEIVDTWIRQTGWWGLLESFKHGKDGTFHSGGVVDTDSPVFDPSREVMIPLQKRRPK